MHFSPLTQTLVFKALPCDCGCYGQCGGLNVASKETYVALTQIGVRLSVSVAHNTRCRPADMPLMQALQLKGVQDDWLAVI